MTEHDKSIPQPTANAIGIHLGRLRKELGLPSLKASGSGQASGKMAKTKKAKSEYADGTDDDSAVDMDLDSPQSGSPGKRKRFEAEDGEAYNGNDDSSAPSASKSSPPVRKMPCRYAKTKCHVCYVDDGSTEDEDEYDLQDREDTSDKTEVTGIFSESESDRVHNTEEHAAFVLDPALAPEVENTVVG